MLDDLLLVFAEAEEEAGFRPGTATVAWNDGPSIGPSINSGCKACIMGTPTVGTLSTLSISHVRLGFAYCGIYIQVLHH